MKLIIAGVLLIVLALGIVSFIGVYVEKNTIYKTDLKCYDRFSNEITGLSCEGEEYIGKIDEYILNLSIMPLILGIFLIGLMFVTKEILGVKQ